MHHIKYVFEFSDGKILEVPLALEPSTLRLQRDSANPPEWTYLDFEQCPNCPLDSDKHPRCPIAVNISDTLMVFNDFLSYEVVNVRIETAERIFQKQVALQDALSSLIGVIMATSGCPVMDHLRPMVRTHLPFASKNESVYRVISMYLMAQYFRSKRGMSSDWELDKLKSLYEDIGIVNHAFSKRMFAQYAKDANINALVILRYVAELLTGTLENNNLESLEGMFEAWFQNE
jgi:hypothetical protein